MRCLQVLVAVCVSVIGTSQAEEKKIPPIEELKKLVGLSPSSTQFQKFLTTYSFSKASKGTNSWVSSGVFLSAHNDRVQVGIRPPSENTNMSVYRGKLPGGLEAEDSTATIAKKLGAPKSIEGDPHAMKYGDLTIYTMEDKLFEIWMIPDKLENKR